MAVTFNGEQKLIIVDFGKTDIDFKVDVYSAWKEWVLISDNSKYPVAISVVGGEPLPGGQFVGSSYFLENNWKIRPFEGNHTLTVRGNLYSRDGSDPFVNTIGSFNVRINLKTSNLVDTVEVSTGSGSGGGSSIDPADIADAVWNRLAILNMNTGSFGSYVNMIKATSDLQLVEILDIKQKLVLATDIISTLLKIETNRTRIDKVQKRMYVYDDDGTTVLMSFDLKDFTGVPSITEVAERVPRT